MSSSMISLNRPASTCASRRYDRYFFGNERLGVETGDNQVASEHMMIPRATPGSMRLRDGGTPVNRTFVASAFLIQARLRAARSARVVTRPADAPARIIL